MQSLQSRLNILYTAFLFSSFVYLIVGFALLRSGWKPLLTDGVMSKSLLGVFILISLSCVVSAFQINKKESEETEKKIFMKSVVLFAFAEVPSILGLVSFLVTGSFTYLVILWCISVAAFILFKPTVTS